MTRARDALAAERRRMPWLAVEKKYEFDGPKGKVSLLDLFEGRKSIAISVVLQPADRTLTEAEIEAVAAKIVAAVNKATGGTLRG